MGVHSAGAYTKWCRIIQAYMPRMPKWSGIEMQIHKQSKERADCLLLLGSLRTLDLFGATEL